MIRASSIYLALPQLNKRAFYSLPWIPFRPYKSTFVANELMIAAILSLIKLPQWLYSHISQMLDLTNEKQLPPLAFHHFCITETRKLFKNCQKKTGLRTQATHWESQNYQRPEIWSWVASVVSYNGIRLTTSTVILSFQQQSTDGATEYPIIIPRHHSSWECMTEGSIPTAVDGFLKTRAQVRPPWSNGKSWPRRVVQTSKDPSLRGKCTVENVGRRRENFPNLHLVTGYIILGGPFLRVRDSTF